MTASTAMMVTTHHFTRVKSSSQRAEHDAGQHQRRAWQRRQHAASNADHNQQHHGDPAQHCSIH